MCLKFQSFSKVKYSNNWAHEIDTPDPHSDTCFCMGAQTPAQNHIHTNTVTTIPFGREDCSTAGNLTM